MREIKNKRSAKKLIAMTFSRLQYLLDIKICDISPEE
jgi:hypothetical protein